MAKSIEDIGQVSGGDPIRASMMNAVISALREMHRSIPSPGLRHERWRIFPAKLDSAADVDNSYAWSEQEEDEDLVLMDRVGGETDVTTGVRAMLIDDTKTAASGAFGLMIELIAHADESYSYRFLPHSDGVSNAIFAVNLTQSGGSNGNKTTACTYTYDLYALSDTGKATKLNGAAIGPECGRNTNGLVTAATKGGAYWDSASPPAIHLSYSNETPGTGGC